MNKDKELLLKDLSARLPYHVRCKIWLKDGTTEEGPLDLEHNYGNVLQDAFYYNKIKDIKPYLRPMSSMSEEEKEELLDRLPKYWSLEIDKLGDLYFDICDACYPDIELLTDIIDWLNAHHFDYRGLIKKGLAIAVTEENNPYERRK